MTPNIVIYSNCQSKGISYCLGSVIEANFHEITNYEYIRNKKELPIETLKKADIFIYQPTKAKHGIYSTDTKVEGNVCSHLKSDCMKIAFPYIYNSSFWAFVQENDNFKDIEPILDLKKSGHSLETVTKMFLNGEIDFEYEKRFNKCMNILREHEKLCDVKVSDFIDANVGNVKLFLTQNHPSTHIYVHCTNQILKLLGSDKDIKQDNYDPNMIGLSGNYANSTYDVRFWKFKFPVQCWDTRWVEEIKKVYNSIKDLEHHKDNE